MTDAAHIIRDNLLAAKRHLEKAQSEVDHRANEPISVSIRIGTALDNVMAALKATDNAC
jgi:hypothetical protein